MKKLVAFSVALALAAGSAFAEWSWGGTAQAGAVLAQGSDDSDTEVTGHLRAAHARISFSGSVDTAIGRMGAWGTLERNHMLGGMDTLEGGDDWLGGSFFAGMNAWWRPIDMLMIQLGNDMWHFEDILRSGDNAHQNIDGAMIRAGFVPVVGLDHHSGFYTGMAEGVIVDLNDIAGMVDFGIGLPYPMTRFAANAEELSDIFAGIHVRARINLAGIGRIGFAYRGSAANNDNGSIFASFHSPAANGLIGGLALNAGVGFHLVENAQVLDAGFGLGWNFAGPFGVGFRGAASFRLGDAGNDANDATRLSFEVVPRLDILEGVRAYVPVAVGMAMAGSGNDADMLLGWRVNPYVRVNLVGNVGFLAGFDIDGNNNRGGDAVMNWAIPIGMRVQF